MKKLPVDIEEWIIEWLHSLEIDPIETKKEEFL